MFLKKVKVMAFFNINLQKIYLVGMELDKQIRVTENIPYSKFRNCIFSCLCVLTPDLTSLPVASSCEICFSDVHLIKL